VTVLGKHLNTTSSEFLCCNVQEHYVMDELTGIIPCGRIKSIDQITSGKYNYMKFNCYEDMLALQYIIK